MFCTYYIPTTLFLPPRVSLSPSSSSSIVSILCSQPRAVHNVGTSTIWQKKEKILVDLFALKVSGRELLELEGGGAAYSPADWPMQPVPNCTAAVQCCLMMTKASQR